MSALNDLFIASDRDLGVLNDRGSPTCKLPGLSDVGVDLVMLCTLEEILTGQDWESIFDIHYINPLKDDGPEGPWVYPISETLTAALSVLDTDKIMHAAGKWAETDEWTVHENNGVDAIAEVLTQLVKLAKQAAAEHKHLFLWSTM